MYHQNQNTANEGKLSISVSGEVNVTHPYYEGVERVTITGKTKSGLIECKRPEAEGGAILLFRYDENTHSLVYEPF